MNNLMKSKVLLLGSGYMYVDIITMTDAIRLIYTNRAEIVDSEYGQCSFERWCEYSNERMGEKIRSSLLSICPPKVLRLIDFRARPIIRNVKVNKANIYRRDKYSCQYCGLKGTKNNVGQKMNIDHVIPTSRGGTNVWDNLVTSCFGCNRKKGNKLPSEINMYPIKRPKEPSAASLFMGTDKCDIIHDEWIPFISYLGGTQ